MENSKDLHLNIETVTPDTEKDGQPNDQKNNHKIENEVAGNADKQPESNDTEPTDSEAKEQKAEAEPNEQATTNEKAVESEEVHDQPESNKQEDEPAEQDKPDEGPEIETVSP